MPTYQRPQVDQLVREITQDDLPLIVAVTGPRQTGKTTMIEQALARIDLPNRYLAVDEIVANPRNLGNDKGPEGQRAWLLDTWEQARDDANRSQRGWVLVLDEVQHVEGWSLIVKTQWDRDRRTGCPLRVVVAGSAPWSMLTGLRESLVGRFMPVAVGHWSFGEMAAAFGFTVDQYVFHGGYPGPARLVKDVDRWRSYVWETIISPGIERDIIALTRIEKPALMRRLMELAAGYSGQILSYNKMLGQLQEAGNATTLADYLDLLSDAGLVTGLLRYSGAQYVARGSSPKLNVLNTALMSVPLNRSFAEVRADRTLWGRMVESAVGAHLHNTARGTVDLHHWRDGPHEVDFVLSRGLGPLGIEVKSGSRPVRARGLEAFRQRFPGARTLLVGGRGVPLQEFLSKPARHWVDHASEAPGDVGEAARDERPDGAAPAGGNGTPTVREPSPEYDGEAAVSPWSQPVVPGWTESEPYQVEAERRRFMAEAREQVTSLRRGEGSAWMWERIGEAFLCAVPGHFNDEPENCLRVRVESDRRLLDAALRGLPHFVHREDLPSLADVVRLHGSRDGDRYCYPVLASLAAGAQPGRDPFDGLDADGVRRAVGSYYLADFVAEPTWYRRAIEEHPELCAEALVAVHRSFIRRRVHCDGHLLALSDDDAHAAVARLAVPTLLGAFPTRCTKPQVSALHALLWAGLLHGSRPALVERIRRRIAASGMDAAQRALWLAAGLLVSAAAHRPEAVAFVLTGREPRARRMLDFLVPERPRRTDLPEPWDGWATADIAALFRTFARWHDPWWGPPGRRYDATTLSLRTDWLLRRWVAILRERSDPESRATLDAMARDPALDRWYEEVTGA